MAETGIYVYGVSRGLSGATMARVTGVSGASVQVIEDEGLAAVTSSVSLAEFGEEALRHNLEDLGWLESTARAHHAVVDAAAEHAVTVPLGLATVYRTEERARSALRERRAEFTQALERITGRTEWGVKAYADLGLAASAAEAEEEEVAGAGPGASYLRRRSAQRHTEEEARQEILLLAERIDDELCALAADRRLHRPQDPQLSGERGWMVLNAAYLVDNERAEAFRAAVTSLAGERPEIRLQLTGPWAPYSFATEEEAWTES
ncbi:GvpL/GvpF family gas vesicle protein [Actinoallomurus bryophytorum]|uniref:Gas vesicle protein GvpL/GvpF n=1 Tax=Actinoallomurus bryophytorum TaxID=1490222 RepID=A0A543CPG0_9ACTN|nr:GvpL/GvpF family gas vesicle protein [Actinoallomurus bryophytorum]TQL98974.1 gas vesicle protein GvpL/GvpF [Actinoallomurus bryophytorum]